MRGFKNAEEYTDMTAGLALDRIDRAEYWDKMDEAKQRMAKVMEEVDKLLKEKGYHLQGCFQIVEDKTSFYLRCKK